MFGAKTFPTDDKPAEQGKLESYDVTFMLEGKNSDSIRLENQNFLTFGHYHTSRISSTFIGSSPSTCRPTHRIVFLGLGQFEPVGHHFLKGELAGLQQTNDRNHQSGVMCEHAWMRTSVKASLFRLTRVTTSVPLRLSLTTIACFRLTQSKFERPLDLI